MNRGMDNHDEGLQSGLLAAVDLGRAGATPNDLAKLLPADPADYDPVSYEALVREIRGFLGTERPRPCVRFCPFLKSFRGHLQ